MWRKSGERRRANLVKRAVIMQTELVPIELVSIPYCPMQVSVPHFETIIIFIKYQLSRNVYLKLIIVSQPRVIQG